MSNIDRKMRRESMRRSVPLLIKELEREGIGVGEMSDGEGQPQTVGASLTLQEIMLRLAQKDLENLGLQKHIALLQQQLTGLRRTVKIMQTALQERGVEEGQVDAKSGDEAEAAGSENTTPTEQGGDPADA